MKTNNTFSCWNLCTFLIADNAVILVIIYRFMYYNDEINEIKKKEIKFAKKLFKKKDSG